MRNGMDTAINNHPTQTSGYTSSSTSQALRGGIVLILTQFASIV